MSVVRVPVGGTFDASNFSSGGVAYSVWANAGVLASSTGLLY